MVFSILGKLFGDAGDQDGMLYVRDEMKRLEIVPNVVVYNTLINGFGRAGRVNIAKDLFEEMCQLGVNPNARTLTAILRIYGKYKRNQDAMDVWARMKENRFVRGCFSLFKTSKGYVCFSFDSRVYGLKLSTTSYPYQFHMVIPSLYLMVINQGHQTKLVRPITGTYQLEGQNSGWRPGGVCFSFCYLKYFFKVIFGA